MKTYTIEKDKYAPIWWGAFTEPNAKGERVEFRISICEGGQLAERWHKLGWTKAVLKTWLAAEVCVYGKDGSQRRDYNPTIKPREDMPRWELSFDWMLEATEDNRDKIIKEIGKRAFAI